MKNNSLGMSIPSQQGVNLATVVSREGVGVGVIELVGVAEFVGVTELVGVTEFVAVTDGVVVTEGVGVTEQ